MPSLKMSPFPTYSSTAAASHEQQQTNTGLQGSLALLQNVTRADILLAAVQLQPPAASSSELTDAGL
jgi:hypothetical protein